ncbi:unnamed protein product [Bathycoccus prasinos]
MDSTQVLCKKDAFVLNFEFKQYRARVNHVARERSLNLSFGHSQGPERGRNAETVTAKERVNRPILNNPFPSWGTVGFEVNTIRQLASKQLAFIGLATHKSRGSGDTNLSEIPDSPPKKDITVESSYRVLCLMSHTGGGHKASAQALKDGFECIYGNSYDVNIVDLWSSHSPWPLCNMPKSYFFLVKNPWLWRLNFRCSEPKIVHETLFRGYAAIVSTQFSRVFMDYNPHLIVSVHPLMQHVPLMSLERLRDKVAKPIPFTTVVTDLTRCHPTWFHKSILKCFVATKIVVSQALSLGLKTTQIICHGLPIRPSFSIPAGTRAYLREKLGMQKDARTVMLIGGGEGMGKITEIAEELSKRLSETHQLVIICGNNRSLVEKLSAKIWPFSVHVKVVSYETFAAHDMSFLDFLRNVGRYARVGTMITRDSVKTRLDSESGMSFTEFSYQLLQGYDFMHLFQNHEVTVQIGGSDQWGNIVAGSDLIRRTVAKDSVFGLTFPLLLKADGKKFGKSEDGAIWLSSERLSPFKFYQYLLNTKDEDVLRLMKMLTFLPLNEIETYSKLMNSKNYVQNSAQVRLAEEVTRFVHGEVGLQKAITATKGISPGSDTELDIDVLESLIDVVPTAICARTDIIGIPIVDVVVKVGLRKSKAEVRRMIDGGGVRINNKKVLDVSTCISPEELIAGRMLLISMGKKNKFLIQVQS